MALKGTLDPSFMSSLFQIYGDEKKTGLLTADCDGLWVEIHIKDGVIVHAAGFGDTPLLAEILRHRSILSSGQVDQVLAEARESGTSVCRILLDTGLMEERDLVPILKRMAKDLLICLFQQTENEFEFHDLSAPADNRVLIHMEIQRVVFDTFRLIDELKEMKKKLPDESSRFVMVRTDKPNSAYTIDAVAWRLLSLIHARQPLKEIVRQSTYNPHEVYLTLLALLDAGIIDISPDGDEEQPAGTSAETLAASGMEENSKGKKLFGLFKKK